MVKDLLYKATILQGLSKLCPLFAGIAARHSMPLNSQEATNKHIERALQLSAGVEAYTQEPIESTALQPIFATVGEGLDSNYSMPTGALSLSDNYFAKEGSSVPNHLPQLQKLASDIEKLEDMSPKAFAETLLTLLYKYTGNIPSGVAQLKDVSLYDYLKTAASLSVSMSDNNGESSLLLLGADFSGIQQYIYTITPPKAAKSLKGRSFYLRLLSDAIVRYLLKVLQLYSANVIYNSGGSFYILAPNNEQTRNSIATAIRRIEQALFDHLGTSLYVAIDYVEIPIEALNSNNDNNNLPAIWKELFLRRDKKKNHKFSALLSSNYSTFFETNKEDIVPKKDSITGEEFLPGEQINSEDDNGSIIYLKPITKEQRDLGEKLRDTNMLIVLDNAKIESNLFAIEPLHLGFTYYFANTNYTDKKLKEQLNTLKEDATLIILNDTTLPIGTTTNICKIEFYGGNEGKRYVKTYEQMSEGDNLQRMGVLRMDVDNLGTIFQRGIPTRKASLARYSTLSRSFDYFFSGYLNTIWENNNPDNSQIIYSGGDDLFIVARWDYAIKLAQEIRNKFKKFTCYNKLFSLSGGVAIVPPKFPLMAAAEESATEESNAKNHTCGESSKDSISFMSTALNWEKEYPVVEKLKEDILEALDKKGMPKSFIQKILQHHSNANIRNHTINNIKTYWMIAYDMKRMAERLGRAPNPALTHLVDNLKKECCDRHSTTLNGTPIETHYHPLELWALAARWADLEKRTNENNTFKVIKK